MDPSSENQNKFELSPRPQNGEIIPRVGGGEARPANLETASNPGSRQPISGVAQDDQSQIATQVAQATMPATSQVQATQSLHPAAPAVADDLDLIEKEWVEKAKGIVEQTKNDPYKQNKEMNLFKADYMKKRYNRDVKVDVS